MRRRDFIMMLAAGAATWPLAARPQAPQRMRRVGLLLGIENDPDGQVRVKAFERRMHKLGWVDGQNIQFEIRWSAAGADRIRAEAEELLRWEPDVIFATSTPVALALRQMVHSIPVVFAIVTDPVGNGLVANLARPEGNLTGLTNFEISMGGKWLEILKEIAPRVTKFGVMFDPANSPSMRPHYGPSVEAAARDFESKLIDLPVHDQAGIERAMADLAARPNSGLIVLPDTSMLRYRELVIAAAAKYRLPAIYPYRFFATSGGLASYGIDTIDVYQQAAMYVDRILRGATPADMPVEPPTKFEFVINLKTARSLGLDISPDLLARTDEVIE
jgi:putative ABC transport system substrate-binding protein